MFSDFSSIGLFSLFAVRHADVLVYAYEPVPPCYAVLERNIAAAGLGQVICRMTGVSSCISAAEEIVFFPSHPGESTRHPAEAAEQYAVVSKGSRPSWKYSCPITTLSAVLVDEGIDTVDLLKVDVEGDELEVLRGIATEDWCRFNQIVLEVHDTCDRLAAIVQLLEANGFVVSIERQKSSIQSDYVMTIPNALNLFYVYAVAKR